jgi:hypothetical protein
MSIEEDLFAGLKALVASDRAYPITFPQAPADPDWPAIRYTFISVDPAAAICGDSGDLSATTRVQIDAVAKTFAAARALRLSIMAFMKTFTPPALFDGSREEYDSETKTFRASLDFLIYASSPSA